MDYSDGLRKLLENYSGLSGILFAILSAFSLQYGNNMLQGFSQKSFSNAVIGGGLYGFGICCGFFSLFYFSTWIKKKIR